MVEKNALNYNWKMTSSMNDETLEYLRMILEQTLRSERTKLDIKTQITQVCEHIFILK